MFHFLHTLLKIFWRPRPCNYFHFRILYVFWSNKIAESCFIDWKKNQTLNHWFFDVLYLLANLEGNMYVWLTVKIFETALYCRFLKKYKKTWANFLLTDLTNMVSKDVSILYYVHMFDFWIKFWKIDHCAITADYVHST